MIVTDLITARGKKFLCLTPALLWMMEQVACHSQHEVIATGLFARNVQSKDLFLEDVVFFSKDLYRVESLRVVRVVKNLHILDFQVDLIVITLRHEVDSCFLHDS